MTSKSPIFHLDEHRRPRFDAMSSKEFEVFFLHFFNAGIDLVIERAGREVKRKVISAELYNAGSGRDQKGIDLTLRVEGGETWVAQCKRHKTWSLPQTKAAVADASVRFPAQHYFLIVACDPAEGVQDFMATQTNWSFWNLDKICSEFRLRVPQAEQPRVLNFLSREELQRFAPNASEALLPADAYFQNQDANAGSFHHKLPLVGRVAELRRLRAFATDRKSKTLVLAGPGGVGKSRLLRELASVPRKSARWPEIDFLNPRATAGSDQADFTLALWDADTPRLVIVENAHRPELLPAALLARARECPAVKLLLATRPSAQEALNSRLRDHGFHDLPELIALAPLPKKELIALAAEALGKDLATHASALVARVGSSAFLLTLAGTLLQRGQLRWDEMVTNDEFRSAIFRCYEEESFADLSPNDRTAATRLLHLMALLAPFTPNESFCQLAGQCFNLSPFDVENLTLRFQAAGLLTSGERELRIVPDLFSDFLVYQAAFDPNKRVPVFVNSVRSKFTDHTGSILRNVAEAVWLAPNQAGGRDELIEALVDEELRRFDDADFFDRGLALERWAHFAIYLPRETLKLARHAWDTVRNAPKTDSEPEGIHSPKFLCSRIPDLLRPIVLWHDDQREAALDLLWNLSASPHFETGANNHPWGIIAKAIGYGPGKSQQATDDTLAWLERLVQRPSARPTFETNRAALATLLRPLFEREVQWRTWQGRTCTFYRRPLSPTEASASRQRALSLLRSLIAENSLSLALAAGSILKSPLHRITGQPTNESEREAWRPERLQALELLKLAIERHPQAVMRHAVRQMLEQGLAYENDPIFEQHARNVLQSMPHDLELRLGTILTTSLDVLDIADHLGLEWSPESEPEIRRHWNKIIDQTSADWLATYPQPAAALTFLATVSDEFEIHGYQTSFHSLFKATGQIEPEAAAQLIDALFSGTGTQTMKTAWPALASAMGTISTILDRARHHPEGPIVRGAIKYLEIRATQSGSLDENGRNLLESIAADNTDPETIEALLLLVISLPANELEWGFRLLRSLPLAAIVENGGASLLMQTLLPFRGKLPPVELARDALAAIVPLPNLTTSRLRYKLSQLTQNFPRECYEFLRARLLHAATLPPEATYAPLPPSHEQRFTLPGLEKEADFSQICDELFARALEETKRNHIIGWTRLFQAVAILHPEHWLQKLQAEIASANDLESLQQLTNLIRFDSSLLIFNHPELARAFLSKAEDIGGSEARTETEYQLHAASGPTIRGYSSSKPAAEQDYVEAAALAAASQHAEDASLGPFYRWIAATERYDRERHRRFAEASLASMDES